ncbi:MAG TPA: ABC transporter substrate-binding protein [Trueperaceae bacterium]|nr:ABC transporter substrate-binding protein [Trueperaceae bacterium]
MTRRVLVQLFIVGAATLLFGLAAAQSIRIGATVAATGAASALGEPEANTFRMLQEQLNAAGGINGVPVEIIFLDTASDTAQAVTNVNRLVQEDDVHVVICCTISANSLAIIDAVQGATVPNISLAASSQIIEPVEERYWVFKTPQTDSLMIGGIVEDMQANSLSTLAYLAIDDAYGEGGLNELNEAIEGTDIEVVAVERYGRSDTNVTAQVLSAVQSQPDAVLIWGVVRDSALVVEEVANRGYEGQVYASHGVGNPSFLELAGEAANGVRLPIGPMIVVDELSDDNVVKPVAQAYVEQYEAQFGEGTASTFGGHAWDAVKAIELALTFAMEQGEIDWSDTQAVRDALRDGLEEMGPFVGVGGVFDYTAEDHLGLDGRALVIVEVVDGDWTLAQ